MQLRKKPEKIEDFNGIWTRDLAILVRCSNQLSYEATNVGSWSIMCSRDECGSCMWNKSYKNCGNEIKLRVVLAVMNAIYAIA